MMEQTQQRQIWADIAKGLTITLIVFHHAVGWLMYQHLLAQEPGYDLNEAPVYFRIPVFFLTAGIFSFSAIHGTAEKFRKRMVLFLYLYVLWCLIRYGAEAALSHVSHVNFDALDLFRIAWQPMPSLWFIYAMLVYSMVARLLRHANQMLVLFGSLIVSLTMQMTTFHPPAIDTGVEVFNQCLAYFMFFQAGLVLRNQLADLSRSATAARTILSVAVFVGCFIFDQTWPDRLPTQIFLTQLAGCIACIQICHLIGQTRLAGVMAAIGRRSLPIYLLHTYLNEIIGRLIVATLPKVLWPLLIYSTAALCIAGSLALYHLALRMKMGWLFAPPAQLFRSPRSRAERAVMAADSPA